MNKINPIFEALSGIDDRHIPFTSKKSHSKGLKIVLIAASAAVLSLLVGFTTAVVRGQYTFGFSKGNSAEHDFELDLTSQKFTIPDEYMSKLEVDVYQGYTDTPFGELMNEFDITPLINDNFTETDQKTRVSILCHSEDLRSVDFFYTLYDKNIKSKISFIAKYFSDTENMTLESHINVPPGEPTKVIALNNGASCLITNTMAIFSYNGVYYSVYCDEMPGMDNVRRVLADLGVL